MCACGPCADRCNERQKYDFDIDRTHTRRLLENDSLRSNKQESRRMEGEGGDRGLNTTDSPISIRKNSERSLDRRRSSTKDIYYYDPVRDEMVECKEPLDEGTLASTSNVCMS